MCKINDDMKPFIGQCSKAYKKSILDDKNYLPKWNNTNAAINYSTISTIDRAFTYTQPDIAIPFFGQMEWYPRGGYLAHMANTLNESTDIIEDLKENEWLDIYTRAIFVEFGTLNANTNLFTFVEVCIEFLVTGDIIYRKEIQSIQLYRYLGGAGILNICAEILTLLFAIIITVQEIRHFIKEKMAYIKNTGNVVTVISFVLFYTAVGLYIWKSLLTMSTVEDVKNNAGKHLQL